MSVRVHSVNIVCWYSNSTTDGVSLFSKYIVPHLYYFKMIKDLVNIPISDWDEHPIVKLQNDSTRSCYLELTQQMCFPS